MHSLVSTNLLETCLNGFFAQFARFVISDELIALQSLLHLGCSSPRWILHELCQRMLCHSTSDDSSLRAGLCHLGSTGTRDTYGIAPSLNYIQSFHFCHHGAVTWMSSRVFAMRCPTDMSTTGLRPTNMGPLIAAVSAVHHLWVTGVCVSYLSPYPVMGICLAFSLMSNFPANPIQSLPFLDPFAADGTSAPRSTVQVCLTGICISQLWSYITWLLK